MIIMIMIWIIYMVNIHIMNITTIMNIGTVAEMTAVAETTIATVGVAIERWGSVGLCAAGVSACGCHPAVSPTRRG